MILSKAKEESIRLIEGTQARQKERADRRKPVLLRELENELKHLDDIDEEEDFYGCEDPCLDDQTLGRLKQIAREARKLELR